MTTKASRNELLDRFNRACSQPPLMMLYPPISSGTLHDGRYDAAGLWRGSKRSGTLYVHIPFCAKRCTFCPFYAGLGTDEEYAGYIDTLLAEAALYSNAVSHINFTSVYLGGGTPSLMRPKLIKKLLDGLRGMLNIKSADVTLESHPTNIDRDSVAAFCEAGVTRVSLGVQSFDPRVLRAAGREDYADNPTAALDAALASPLRDVNIDLMYGLPEQSMDSWANDLKLAAERTVPSLTLYATVYLPAFESQCEKKEYMIPGATERLDMYEHAYAFLNEAGYPQPHFGAGAFLRKALNPHRKNVELGLPTLGLGTWAYSNTGRVGYHNETPNTKRAEMIQQGRLPIRQVVEVKEEERARKYVIEAMLLAYLNLAHFRAEMDKELEEVFPEEVKLLRELELTVVQDGELRLTRKGGRHLREIRYLFASKEVVDALESGAAKGL